MERTYRMRELSELQLEIIQDALEVYFRIQINQYDLLAYSNWDKLGNKFSDFREDLEALERKYNLPNKLEGKAAIASDIQQVIRHRLSWDRHPEGGITLNFDKPLRTGTEKLPKVEQEDE